LIFDYCVHFAFVSCLHVEVLFVCEDFWIAFLCIFFNHVIFYNFLVIMTTLLCCMGFFFLVFISCDDFVKELWTNMNMDIENNFAMATKLFVLVITILQYNVLIDCLQQLEVVSLKGWNQDQGFNFPTCLWNMMLHIRFKTFKWKSRCFPLPIIPFFQTYYMIQIVYPHGGVSCLCLVHDCTRL